jgi:Flp pilus assembly protein TadG
MRTLMTWLRRRGEGGQTLAEFAMLMPIITLVIFGLVDMSRAMQAYVTIQEGARDGTRYAVTGRIDCDGPAIQNRANCIKAAVQNRTEHLDNTSSITVQFRHWDYPSYADPAEENDAGEQCDAVEVEVHYTYKPITPVFRQLVKDSVGMSARERLVNEPFGTCS